MSDNDHTPRVIIEINVDGTQEYIDIETFLSRRMHEIAQEMPDQYIKDSGTIDLDHLGEALMEEEAEHSVYIAVHAVDTADTLVIYDNAWPPGGRQ